MGGCILDASVSRYVPMADSCEHGNKSAVYVDGEFLDELVVYWFLKKDSTSWILLVN
jgi:hypothetical protein